ncbi:mannose-1-phosphate guanylyltransferase/mannose-6-phosphate isomerase [Planktotalea arctica]|uniref:mannose-1-phosphate guanylyltransferase/mannose-6-phosphate isomerase n=1 Tax=Planktotalea arctica TaxID=1481893 RepID=UPI000A177DF1|nr:mannose-1-phosphate guanylyltransferase/mannose-6-phosphate isomerase [Planktotalea arctica]
MITPVILAGGSGTRLWPLSRKSYPKQFADLGQPDTLFQATVKRLAGKEFRRPVLLTSEDYRFIVTEQMGGAGVLPEAIFIEPEPRDTAPAVLVAALFLQTIDPDGLMLIAPADHAIPDGDAFRGAVAAARSAAEAGSIVTFGITPDRPETGYGYLELSGDDHPEGLPQPLKSFVEKPNVSRAKQMLASGDFLWNAGIFLVSVKTMCAAFAQHAPQMMDHAQAALDGAEQDLGFRRLNAAAFGQIEKISLDYAIMEKADNLQVMAFSEGWSDLGDWEALRRISDKDERGTALVGAATSVDCEGSLLWSASEGQELVGIGLENIIAVAMPDAVLIADRSRVQDVKEAVAALQVKGAKQASQFTRDHRPWGWFDSLAMGPRFQVKRIVVTPGSQLSLQSHVHRAEHWIVVEGTAHVTIDDAVTMVTENQSVFIPLGAVHRMENRGKVNMTLIEVQTGSYLGEDDITRYEDVYSRK